MVAAADRLRQHFNPRSPDGERLDYVIFHAFDPKFQSTLPGWGATDVDAPRGLRANHFNPRSPDGERHTCHPPDARSSADFNPRSPDGERRRGPGMDQRHHRISIHAPRMGSDGIRKHRETEIRNFNPRSPDGERPGKALARLFSSFPFQSTLPGWGATGHCHALLTGHSISIHAPRMGSDFVQRFITPPASLISIHAPRMGSDQHVRAFRVAADISIHAPRMGSDAMARTRQEIIIGFQSTLPGWGATPNPVIRSIRKTNFNPRSPDGERLSM